MKGMVSAPQPLAVDAGVRVLADGGNAVDAAVTAAFVQMVTTPRSCGVGGFGMMYIHTPESDTILDFHGKAGARVRPEMWEHEILQENATGYGYTLKGQVNERGYGAVTTPGTVAGLHRAQADYGTMPWRATLQPGIAVATGGHEVTRAAAAAWKQIPTPETTPWTTVAASPREGGGELIANPDMARTFSVLAEGGEEAFYRGEMAETIAGDMEKGGGFVTLEDLNRYEVTVTSPLQSRFRNFTVASNHPPGGGLTILQMLNILEGYDLSEMGHLSGGIRAYRVDGDESCVDGPGESDWRPRIRGRSRGGSAVRRTRRFLAPAHRFQGRNHDPAMEPAGAAQYHPYLRCGSMAQRGGAHPLAGVGFGCHYAWTGLHVQ